MKYYVNVQDDVVSYISPVPTGLKNEIELDADALSEIIGFVPIFLKTTKPQNVTYFKEVINQI